MTDKQLEALRIKYGFDKIGIIEGEMYLPMKEVFEKLVQRWIPVDKELPDSEDYVLVCDDDDVFIAYYQESNKRWLYDTDEGSYFTVRVDAWMPLPEPYKEEGACDE